MMRACLSAFVYCAYALSGAGVIASKQQLDNITKEVSSLNENKSTTL